MHTSALLLILPALLSSVSVTAAPHTRGIEARHAGDIAHDRMAYAESIKRMIRRKKRSNCPAKSTDTPASTADAASTATTQSATSTLVNNVNAAYPTGSAQNTTGTNTGGNAGTVASGMMGEFFPMTPQNSWTTWTGASDALSFNSALKPLSFGKLPSQSNAPDGSSALVANYPAGTFKYSASTGHGYSFYTEGQHNNVNVEGARDVIFSYSVWFQDGFDFVKGGKMPGLYGGTSMDSAKSCSGGRQDSRDECFSARLMWRANGAGEFYNYYPISATEPSNYCSIPPKSVCDAQYGDSIGRGSFNWGTNTWTTVTQRVRLNDVGQANGEQQLWVNGQPVMHLTGLEIIVKPAKIYGIMAQTFFGGSDASWASPKDQSAWFKDWSLAVIE